MKYSALILGCGNIGALYDLDNPSKVWTHAKAFSKSSQIIFSVFDIDKKHAKKIASRYKVEITDLKEQVDFRKFDIVSITTPTPTHFGYLKTLLKQNIPLVICEKPIASDMSELNELTKLYKNAHSKVVVNYIRRFQPAYAELQHTIKKLSVKSPCTGINITYQRGLLNNGSHAFDILEFLFKKPFLFKNFALQNIKFDAFFYDPTVSGTCSYNGCPVMILGIEKAVYPIFEIELFFSTQKIVICNSGDELRFYEYDTKRRSLQENKTRRRSKILSRYMIPVTDKAIQMLKKKSRPDNFLQAVQLNKRIIKLIAELRKKAG
ncbi:MAG TPA: Gfo/Idh/MocA family oxidoreductase [Chitinophagaceae bacterium]